MSTVSLPVFLLSFPCFSPGEFSALYCNTVICHMINAKVLSRSVSGRNQVTALCHEKWQVNYRPLDYTVKNLEC